MKIAAKIVLAFSVLGVIITVAASFIFYSIAKDALTESIFSQLKIAEESRAQHVLTYLSMLKENALQMSESVVIKNLLKLPEEGPGREAALGYVMKRLKKTKDAIACSKELMVLDAGGKVVASSDEAAIGLDKATDPYFIEGRKGVFIKDAYISTSKNMPLLATSAPIINDETGGLLGVVVVRTTMDELDTMLTNREGLGRTGEMYIVNREGYMITPSRFLSDAAFKQKIETENIRRCLVDCDKFNVPYDLVRCKDYRGAMVLSTHLCLREMRWILVTDIDAAEALAPLRLLRLVAFSIIIIVPIIVFIAGSLIAQTVTKPIIMLKKETELIGEGDLDYRVGTTARDEVGDLSRAFDKMTQDLKKTTVSINALNAEIAERKRAEAAARQASEQWQTTFDSSGDPIMLLDIQHSIVRANKATAIFLKMPIDKIIGKRCYELIHGTDKPLDKCPVVKAVELKKAVEAELYLEKMKLWVRVSASPIISDSGVMQGTVHTVHDITASKKIEQEKMRNSDTHRVIGSILDLGLQSMPIQEYLQRSLDVMFSVEWLSVQSKGGIFLVSGSNTLVLQAQKGLSGYLMRACAEVPFGKCLCGRAVLTKKIVFSDSIDDRHDIRYDGMQPHGHYCVPMVSAGRVVGVLNTYLRESYQRDEATELFLKSVADTLAVVVERRTSEEMLAESEARYRALYNSSADAIMTLAPPDWLFTAGNPATVKMFACKDEDEFTSKKPYELSPEYQPDGKSSKEKALEMITTAMEKGTHFFEWSHKRTSGEEFFATVLLTKVTLREKSFLQATVRDITDEIRAKKALENAYQSLRQAQAKLIEEEKMSSLGRFSLGAAHEIKNPLGIIIGGAEYLQAKIKDADEAEVSAMEKVKNAALRANEIIEALVRFSEPLALKQENIGLNELARGAIEEFSSLIAGSGVSVDTELTKEDLRVSVDASYLRKAVSDVLMNALEAIDVKPGKITLRTVKLPSAEYLHGPASCAIEVADTGGGIAPVDLSRVFEPFFTTKRDKRQVGLGLTIARTLVRSNGGDIFVSSEKGRGTVVKIVLPLS